jgi:fermentation-respiration switch protein FrsA (DUF1100 family)
MRAWSRFVPAFWFWLRLLVGVLAGAYVGIIAVGAVLLTIMVMTPLKGSICCRTPRDFGAAYEAVRFPTADGLQLAGWYVPGRNGAVIILLHNYYGDRREVLPVAAMLARHGYGLLMYDQRASGESEGDVRSLGLLDIPDVNSAVDYLHARGRQHIAAYGCSMGASLALAAAAGNQAIVAVAADAPSPLTFDETYDPAGDDAWLVNLPLHGLSHALVTLRSGAWPPMSITQATQRLAPRPLLLLSTGRGGERERIDALFAAAAEPKQRLSIPDAGHCAAPLSHPSEYEQHLLDFFDQAFLR